MLFKILGIQRAWEMSAVDMPKPRQIFVTKSRVLATKMEEYFTKLLESSVLAGYTPQELAKMRAQSVQEGLVDLDDLPESLTIVTIYGQTARMRYSRSCGARGSLANRSIICMCCSYQCILSLTTCTRYVDEAQDNLLNDALGK
jgi:hypothetical protein